MPYTILEKPTAPQKEPAATGKYTLLEPKTEPKQEPSLVGTGLDVGRGLVEGVATMPGSFLKIGLAAQRIGQEPLKQLAPDWYNLLHKYVPTPETMGKWIDDFHGEIHKQLSVGPKGYSTHIGPVEISGETLGGLLSGVAMPGALAGKASQAVTWGGRAWSAMKAGAAFGAASSVPDVFLSKDWKQFNDRLVNAGINIGIGGLLAGAVHGSAEVAGKLFSLAKPGAPVEIQPRGESIKDRPVKGGPGAPPAVQEPHLNITPGIEGAPMIPEADVIKIKAEREGIDPNYSSSPRGRTESVASEVDRLKKERWKIADQDESFVRKGVEYTKLLSEIEANRVKIKDQERLMKEFEKRGLFNQVEDRPIPGAEGQPETTRKGVRTELIEMIDAQKAREAKFNELHAELEGIAEVVAARGRTLREGQLWEPSSGESFVEEAYKNEVADELTRRVRLKQEALKGTDPHGVMTAGEPMEETPNTVVQEGTSRLKEIGKMEKTENPAMVDAVERARQELLADQISTMESLRQGAKSIMRGEVPQTARDLFKSAVDAWRMVVNPMGQQTEKVRGAFDVLAESEKLEHAMVLLHEAIKKDFSLEERQLFALMNDPRGKLFLNGIKIDPRLSAMMDTYRVMYDKLFNIGVRDGVISPAAFWEDFVNRVYDRKSAKKMMEFLTERKVFDAQNPHSMERVFAHLWEARAANLKPRTLDIAQIFPEYVRSINRTITNNKLIQNLEAVSPESFKYVKDGHIPQGFKRAPEGLLGNVRNDGTQRYIANKEWTVIDNLLSQSRAPNALDRWNTWNKKIKLSIDVYHMWQLMRGYVSMTHDPQPFGKWKEGYKMLSEGHEKNPLIQEGIRNGLSLGIGDYQKVEFDKSLAALAKLPWTSKLLRNIVEFPLKKAEGFSNKLWGEISPGLKAMMYVKNLERLLADSKMQGLTRDELSRAAARMTNKVGGGSPWREFGRSRDFERVARLMVLAPNWIETRFRLFGGGIQAAVETAGLKATTAEGQLYKKYWTGYVLQGLITAAAGNALIRAAYPEVTKHKEARGLGFFTHITFPTEDRNGRPLVMSPYPGLDYVFEAINDLDKFYKNRESPAMQAFLHTVTGVDYKGAKDRPRFWSFDTFANVVGDALPIPMLGAGEARVMDSETPKFEQTKVLMRSLVLGLHNHPTYPVALRDEEDFLKNEAADLRVKMKAAKDPIRKAYFGWKARRHDDAVRDWIKEAQKTEGAEKILATVPKFQRQLFVGAP